MLKNELENLPENTTEKMFEKPSKAKKKRAWKSKKLPRVFTVRADEDEYKKLKKMADKTGWSLSRLLIEATLNHGVKPADESKAERKVFEEIIFEVRRVGINVNQILYRLNANRRKTDVPLPSQNELDAALKEIETVLEKLKKKL